MLLEELMRCVKSVRIRSFTAPYFPAFRLNTERYVCGKMWTKKNSEYEHFFHSDDVKHFADDSSQCLILNYVKDTASELNTRLTITMRVDNLIQIELISRKRFYF